ncbi:hypothetical protein [Reyranella sp.]|uniref:hypothetical protein n=1 Tax=Reyranella sp. TaxID=1929291 RepID=UPI003BA8D7B0
MKVWDRSRSIAIVAAAVAAMVGAFAAAASAQTDPRVRTATPSKGLLWGSKMTVESGPCCAAQKGAKAGDPAEAAVLAKLGDRAARDGPILWLRLQNGRLLKITDCDDENACEADRFRRHRLAAWWPSLGLYVVDVGLYEEGLAYLIAEKDGQTTRVASLPVLSPSGKRAVALQSNLMNGVDLDVIDFTTHPPKVTKVQDLPACPGSGKASFLRPRPVWVDETHVRFEGKSPLEEDDPKARQLLRLVDGQPQWQC